MGCRTIFAFIASLTVLIFGQQRGQMPNPQSIMTFPYCRTARRRLKNGWACRTTGLTTI